MVVASFLIVFNSSDSRVHSSLRPARRGEGKGRRGEREKREKEREKRGRRRGEGENIRAVSARL